MRCGIAEVVVVERPQCLTFVCTSDWRFCHPFPSLFHTVPLNEFIVAAGFRYTLCRSPYLFFGNAALVELARPVRKRLL